VSWLTDLAGYIADDPIRLLTLLGGSGGALYWFDRIRNRTRVKVRLLRERFTEDSDASVEFEITNVGQDPTSLEPTFVMTGFTPKGARRSIIFDVESQDRHLPPHVQKRITAVAPRDPVLVFLWFKTYRILLTRGASARLRIDMANGEPLSRTGYYLGLLRFRLFGRVRPTSPESQLLE
jgi:hypothetical protein